MYGLCNASLDTPWYVRFIDVMYLIFFFILFSQLASLSLSSLSCRFKVERGKQLFAEATASSITDKNVIIDNLFENVLGDHVSAPSESFVGPSLGPTWDADLSSIFVHSPVNKYGTRSMAVIIVDKEGHVTFTERSLQLDSLKFRNDGPNNGNSNNNHTTTDKKLYGCTTAVVMKEVAGRQLPWHQVRYALED